MKYLAFLSLIVFLGAQGDPNAPYEAWLRYCEVDREIKEVTCKCKYLGTWKTLKSCSLRVSRELETLHKNLDSHTDWGAVGKPRDFCFGKRERSWPKPHPTYHWCKVSYMM